jgi:xanthine dehydrogenase large subunit
MPTVGKPIPHDSAIGHVTGRAPYIDDIPPRSDELFVGFVGSPLAAGKIESIDADAAKAMPGVKAVYTIDDLPGHRYFGPILVDEPVFADGEVLYVGQPVVVIAAESRAVLAIVRCFDGTFSAVIGPQRGPVGAPAGAAQAGSPSH